MYRMSLEDLAIRDLGRSFITTFARESGGTYRKEGHEKRIPDYRPMVWRETHIHRA